MTIRFLVSMLVDDLEVKTRTPIGGGCYMTIDKEKAGDIKSGNSKFYENTVSDYFFKKDKIVITVIDPDYTHDD